MKAYRVNGRAINIGYRWTQRLQFAGSAAFFPSGCAITAHVRATPLNSQILATLTTANGGIARVSDVEIDISLTAAQTAAMKAGSVVVDFVRTAPSPTEHLGFRMTIPVVPPVTQGVA